MTTLNLTIEILQIISDFKEKESLTFDIAKNGLEIEQLNETKKSGTLKLVFKDELFKCKETAKLFIRFFALHADCLRSEYSIRLIKVGGEYIHNGDEFCQRFIFESK